MNSDIEIEIGAGSGTGHYAVRVLRAAAGGEPTGTLELDVEEILSKRELLESTVLASAVARRSVPVAEQRVREVGLQLFSTLFTGPVYGMYRASLGVAQQRGKRLRVVLRLTAPELAALPWEMLFDPETATYLCRQEPLVRHVHVPYTAEPLAVRPPLRVLGLIASPLDLPMLDVDAEKSHLAEALAGPIAEGLIELVWAPEATWQGIHAQLLAGQWHVLHFVGHGDYDTRTDEGVLALVGVDGRADLVEADRLADLLDEAQPTPRLVVLNSCSSGRSGVNDLFSGTAAVLARSGIGAVAAMQFTISDTAAIAFARGFYTAIAHGRSIDEAARSGRISILGAPRSLEWVTPVLYVRGQPSQLFALTAPPHADRETLRHRESPGEQPPVSPQFPESDRRRRAELRALYVEARAELRLEHFSTAIGLFDDLLTLDPGYADAIDLRDKAQRSQQLADGYASAVAAEDTGDWAAAARGYGEILRADPAYKDAADRKDACERRQRVADLDAELRHHASDGQWQPVLDVDAELARIDPSASDPDGLASQARAALAAAQRAADLECRYDQARAAEDNQQWSVAADGYNEVLEIDSAYRDAETRRDHCRQRNQIAVLESELKEQTASEDWRGVLTSIKKLAALDPAAAAKSSWTDAADRARLVS
jgi:CHAT domain